MGLFLYILGLITIFPAVLITLLWICWNNGSTPGGYLNNHRCYLKDKTYNQSKIKN